MAMKKNKYRNLQAVVSDQGVEIDKGSLWEFDKENNLMVLVDDDEYHTCKPNTAFITEALYKKPSQ